MIPQTFVFVLSVMHFFEQLTANEIPLLAVRDASCISLFSSPNRTRTHAHKHTSAVAYIASADANVQAHTLAAQLCGLVPAPDSRVAARARGFTNSSPARRFLWTSTVAINIVTLCGRGLLGECAREPLWPFVISCVKSLKRKKKDTVRVLKF